MKIVCLLALSSVIPTFVLAICIALSGKERRASNIFLGMLFATISLLTASAVILSDWTYMFCYPIGLLCNLTVMLFGPFFYLFIRSTIEDNFAFKKSYFAFFIPFLASFIFFFAHTVTHDPFYGRFANEFRYKLFESIQNALYFLLALAAIRKSGTSLIRFFFDFSDRRLTWLRFLFVSLIVFWYNTVYTAIMYGQYHDNAPYYMTHMSIFFAFSCVFLCVALFVFIKRQQPKQQAEKKKYAVSTLTEDDKQLCYARVLNSMNVDKLYLDPELSLGALARKVRAPVKAVSQVINEKAGLNFNDFINEFRIRDFCGKLENAPGETPILEMLLESGFNSKSTFNDVFKKKTGVTPSEYRQSLKK
jgi:AraC-like DNA-binding protein